MNRISFQKQQQQNTTHTSDKSWYMDESPNIAAAFVHFCDNQKLYSNGKFNVSIESAIVKFDFILSAETANTIQYSWKYNHSYPPNKNYVDEEVEEEEDEITRAQSVFDKATKRAANISSMWRPIWFIKC